MIGGLLREGARALVRPPGPAAGFEDHFRPGVSEEMTHMRAHLGAHLCNFTP